MTRSLARVLTLLLVVGSAAADGARAQEPEYELSRIADGVYMFRYRSHNAMFVVTGDGVVAFDPISVEAARIYKKEIRKVTSEPIRAIVYSHHHADHITGADELAEGVPIFAHALAQERLAAEPGPDIAPPTRAFDEGMTIFMGDTELRLLYLGRNHSDNSVVAYLPQKGVIFAVDFVSNDRVGYRDLPGYYFPDLWESLERLQQLDYRTAIFGHGPPGTKGDVYEQINYWTDLRHWAELAVGSGLSEDDAVEKADLPDYRAWGGYEDWFKMNARAVYRYYADER